MANRKHQQVNESSSMLFLQQEHAKTLEGLYKEISKLQKKCGGLTLLDKIAKLLGFFYAFMTYAEFLSCRIDF